MFWRKQLFMICIAGLCVPGISRAETYFGSIFDLGDLTLTSDGLKLKYTTNLRGYQKQALKGVIYDLLDGLQATSFGAPVAGYPEATRLKYFKVLRFAVNGGAIPTEYWDAYGEVVELKSSYREHFRAKYRTRYRLTLRHGMNLPSLSSPLSSRGPVIWQIYDEVTSCQQFTVAWENELRRILTTTVHVPDRPERLTVEQANEQIGEMTDGCGNPPVTFQLDPHDGAGGDHIDWVMKKMITRHSCSFNDSCSLNLPSPIGSRYYRDPAH